MTTFPDTLIYNGTVVNENRRYEGYVAITGSVIAEVGEGMPPQEMIDGAAEAIDAAGAYILPGAIDDQVHFRDPGLTHKADIATESAAAAAGGVTSFMDMPNTKPPTVSREALRLKMTRASEASVVNYAFFLGATDSNLPELLECDYSRVPGVKVFLGSSTGNMLVDSAEALDRIFSTVPAIIAVHSEDEQTIRRNADEARARYGGDDVPVWEHPAIRSREACVISTRAAIERARRLSTRLHVLHVSTAEEAAMFAAGPVEEKKITAEVCVHHLWFTDEDYRRLGTRVKMNPAIKTAADREALREALREGRIDIVATDHAPHLPAEKEGGALKAASGAPMVQFSLPLMIEMADQGVFTLEMVVDRMCHAPARLFGIPDRGFLRPGYKADVAIVMPDSPYEVTDSMVLSRCGWTPLAGTTLHNRVVATVVNGRTVYTAAMGVDADARVAEPLRFDRI